jgi:hypothetical protein
MKNLCLIYVSMVTTRRRQLISMVIGVDDLVLYSLIMGSVVARLSEDQHALPVRVRACEARDLILE